MSDICIAGHEPCVLEDGYCIRCGGKAKLAAPKPIMGILPSSAHATSCPECSEPRVQGRYCPTCRYDYRNARPFDAATYPLVSLDGLKISTTCVIVVLMEGKSGVIEEIYRVNIKLPSCLELGRGSKTGLDTSGRLSIADAGVSRSHLSINIPVIGQAECTDLGSSNGTFLDGVAMQPHTPCSVGKTCSLLIGECTVIRLSMEVS